MNLSNVIDTLFKPKVTRPYSEHRAFILKLHRLRYKNPKNDTYFQAIEKLENGFDLDNLYVTDELDDIKVGTESELLDAAYHNSDTIASSARQDMIYENMIPLVRFIDSQIECVK